MCEKCAELDRKIEHYERMSALIGDQLTVGRIKGIHPVKAALPSEACC